MLDGRGAMLRQAPDGDSQAAQGHRRTGAEEAETVAIDFPPSRRALLAAGALLPLRPSSLSSGATPSAQDTFDVTDYGARGDGAQDDHPAIARAIAAAAAGGGGRVLLPHPGPWAISRPIALASNVVLAGVQQNTVIRFVAGAEPAAVITARDQTRFGIQNLTLVGDRPPGARPVRSARWCDGLYLKGCAYFEVHGVRADYCGVGLHFEQCYTFGVEQATALRCASYGFVLEKSCTSFVLRNTTSWGCGGGWRINSSSYGSLLGCACDLSDAGGRPDDPFGDSGGDHLQPAFIFDLGGSKGITIVAPGCENCCSQWLYVEGTQATILNPYIFGMQAHASDWRLIQMRGTAYANVSIACPFGFDSVTNVGKALQAIFIEDPGRQRLYLSGRWRVNEFSESNAYPAAGLVVEGARLLVDHGPLTRPGPAALLTTHPGDAATVEPAPEGQLLRLRAGGHGVFAVPLPGEGLYQVTLRGAGAMLGGLELGLAPGVRAPAPAWRAEPAARDYQRWFYLPPAPAAPFLVLRLPANQTLELKELRLTHIAGQF